MKLKLNVTLFAILLGFSTSNMAQSPFPDPVAAKQQAAMANALKKILTHLDNLGLYLGNWVLAKKPTNQTVQSFQDVVTSLDKLPLAFVTTLPIVKLTKNISLLNGNSSLSQYINTDFLNYDQPTNLPLNQGVSKVAAIKAFDQAPYQQTPTNQAVQNLLSYPASYLITSIKPTTDTSSNDPVYKAITESICGGQQNNGDPCITYPLYYLSYAGGYYIGDILSNKSTFPYLSDITNGKYNQKLIPSLSFDSLVGPMVYSTQSMSNDSKMGNETKGAKLGFYGNTQKTQADAYIRYASGSVLPLPKPNAQEYDNLVSSLSDQSTPALDRAKALGKLNTYNLMLRVYAAELSTGMSNLYYLMGKRISNPVLGKSGPNSQAALEFNMATNRLFNPGKAGAAGGAPSSSPGQTKWMQDMLKASSQDAARQSAILLAEMNYQMYLNRQVLERLLATMSVMQLQLLSTARTSISLDGTPSELQAQGAVNQAPSENNSDASVAPSS